MNAKNIMKKRSQRALPYSSISRGNLSGISNKFPDLSFPSHKKFYRDRTTWCKWAISLVAHGGSPDIFTDILRVYLPLLSRQ